jgi:hypothetical protein
MADCEWVILCDYAFAAEGGKLCLVGIFDKIYTNAVPSTHAQAAVAFGLLGDDGETVTLRIQIVRPTGGVLVNVGGPAKLGPGVTRGHIPLHQLVLPDFGNYAIEVYNGETLLRATTFAVEQRVPTRSPAQGGEGPQT